MLSGKVNCKKGEHSGLTLQLLTHLPFTFCS